MTKRYKVIADYPESPHRVDDILEMVVGPTDVYINSRTGQRFIVGAPAYPAIFRKLEWWEEREPSELPEYLNYKGSPFKLMRINHELKRAVWNEQGYGPPMIECTPATEAEYLEYRAEWDRKMNEW